MAEMLTRFLNWLGHRVAVRRYYVLLLFPPLLALLAANFDLSVTAATILPFGRVSSSCIKSIKRNVPRRFAALVLQEGMRPRRPEDVKRLTPGGFRGFELLAIRCWTSRHVKSGLKHKLKRIYCHCLLIHFRMNEIINQSTLLNSSQQRCDNQIDN